MVGMKEMDVLDVDYNKLLTKSTLFFIPALLLPLNTSFSYCIFLYTYRIFLPMIPLLCPSA